MNDVQKLSTRDQWSDRWSERSIQELSFNPHEPAFSDIHRFFSDALPKNKNFRFLEVGSFPGRYLWYFQNFFDYQVSGLEYVEWCCEKSRQLLENSGVTGQIIHGDLFKYQPDDKTSLWDVVASFGFIEHFSDTTHVIQKHLDLLKPGGYLVLVIPNHQGIYGDIMKFADYEKYKTHNRMSYEDMCKGLENTSQAKVLAGGYLGRLGFWNTGIYARLRSKGKLVYTTARTPLWALERLGKVLPNSASLSPSAALIAQKLS